MPDNSPTETSRYSRRLLSCALGVAVLPLIVIITLQALSIRTESAAYSAPRQPDAPSHQKFTRTTSALCGICPAP
jgi:hypothetical protein